MQAFWKDACDEGGLAWDDTNNNRAFLAGEISATLNGASIYIAAKRGQDKIKDDKGEPMVRDIEHARAARRARPARGATTPPSRTAVMKYAKNQKLAKDFLKWLHGKEQLRQVVRGGRGLLDRLDQVVGAAPAVEHDRRADEGLPQAAADNSRVIGYAGPPSAKATEVYTQVHHRRHVRQGRAGHEGRGRREVGRRAS